MKNFIKLNFKKIFTVYIVLALIAGTTSAVTLGVVFGDKISLMMAYDKISSKCEDSTNSLNMKDELTDFAKPSDVADIYILDKNNSIIFSAKNSGLAQNNFDLQTLEDKGINRKNEEKDNHAENDVLYDPANPNVYYKVIEGEHSPRALMMFVNGFSSYEEFESNYFYKSGGTKVYSLSYMVDRQTGNKTYFIFDITPIKNSGIYLKVIASIAMLFFMVYWVLIAFFVYVDATKSKLRGAIWGILTLFTNLGGLIIYLIFKQTNQTCMKCSSIQNRENSYCTYCGAKLTETCEKCGGKVKKDDLFCKDCGAQQEIK
ncbi:MAG: zinc ribbon domain-containing protein [Bacillota bacterium]|nr:zinc ribbon domain-containing protein [Bacillota bacterium]